MLTAKEIPNSARQFKTNYAAKLVWQGCSPVGFALASVGLHLPLTVHPAILGHMNACLRMSRFGLGTCWALLLVVGWTLPALAAEDAAKLADKAPAKEKGREEERLVETRGQVSIEGRPVEYLARTGTLVLRDGDDKPSASVFYVAYFKQGETNLARRPITFSFNGGPGSSSVWMHLGLLGPRRVRLQPDGMAVPPPYTLMDNEFSLLDTTDLVFIDPVSTGFSRAIKSEDARKFHGLREDISSVGDFIRLFVTRHQRWASPKFVIGESYGTTRAAGLSGELAQRHKMNLNGIMLVSTVLNFATLDFEEGNDLPYVLFLPTYAAAAWHHKKLAPEFQQLPLPGLLARVEAFATGDYQQILFRGASASAAERRKVATTLAGFTGLTPEFVERANLRVRMSRFAAELLAGESQVVGRFDSRYRGPVRDRLAGGQEYDPSAEAVFSVFGSTFNHYLRTELRYESDVSYELLNGAVNPWNWGEQNSYVNVGEILAGAMTRNPFLKVYVANGFFDLATPYFASRYTFNHLNVDAALLRNLSQEDYTAGHMMYLNVPDLKKMKQDLVSFINGAVPQ
jgi:carboxypeptidase C (cathepsin A)